MAIAMKPNLPIGASKSSQISRLKLAVNAMQLKESTMSSNTQTPLSIAIIGGGPAGLMAAEVMRDSGVKVDVFDAMPSVGRKFLLAGRGGMNITHAEPSELFLSRYGKHRTHIESLRS